MLYQLSYTETLKFGEGVRNRTPYLRFWRPCIGPPTLKLHQRILVDTVGIEPKDSNLARIARYPIAPAHVIGAGGETRTHDGFPNGLQNRSNRRYGTPA